ncbi:hypothetical protein [Sulfurimonas sp.]|uniref:hypothetical protein n=1 Tax=Sulfurimonas sp. TaxID=2022749 RepID=UPI001A0A4ACA|nr:hypothetical protein [Sulfurimonas sp.]MBE0515158.1 hypothetical protein [Sulfurimonas sp.]
MIKILIIFTALFVTSAFSACDGLSVYDTQTALYSHECASLYLNMSQQDHSFQMALAGQLAGFTFMFVTLMFLFLMGRRR